MALVTTFTCKICGKEKYEVVYDHHTCQTCYPIEARAKKSAHMAYLKELPLEDRVRLIEEYIYEKRLDERLRDIEVRNIRY
jgi:hypothetical protein